MILRRAKHVNKTLYALPTSPGAREPRRGRRQHIARTRTSEQECDSNRKHGTTKTQHENDTYNFGLQGVNFGLDSLLLLVARSLVGFATTIFNECDCRSRESRRGRRGRFRGSRGIALVGRRFWFFGLRILSGGSFGFGGGSHGRGDQGQRGDGDRYMPGLYTFALATWRDMR